MEECLFLPSAIFWWYCDKRRTKSIWSYWEYLLCFWIVIKIFLKEIISKIHCHFETNKVHYCNILVKLCTYVKCLISKVLFCNEPIFFFQIVFTSLNQVSNWNMQTWKSYLVRSCASFFHFWTKYQGKVQLRLANFGLIWSEIQIYSITFATREIFRSFNKGSKICNGIGKEGHH